MLLSRNMEEDHVKIGYIGFLQGIKRGKQKGDHSESPLKTEKSVEKAHGDKK